LLAFDEPNNKGALSSRLDFQMFTGHQWERLKHDPAAYALRSADKSWVYKGSARDLADRISAHFSGKVSRTKNRRPLELVYYEYCENYTDARRRENWLKSGQGREWLKKHIAI
jgi:putative endonuclease